MQRISLLFLDTFALLNPNPNDASVYMLSVLRFGQKKCIFLSKNMFLACSNSKLLHFFLFRCVLIITFLLQFLVIQLHIYCSLCILSKNVNFKGFFFLLLLLKCQFSPCARYVIKNLL